MPPRRPAVLALHSLALSLSIAATGCPGAAPAPSSPPSPASAPSAPAPTYGDVMAGVARRFELLGRAGAAGRFEFAEYQLGELEEVFAGPLLAAERPKEGHPEVLPAMQYSFVEQVVPELRRGIASLDSGVFSAAFARAAARCNGCHEASGHGFIRVPSAPGRAIPDLDPAPARATR